MRLNSKIIERFMELCPNSTQKCDSFSEIEFKIKRAANIGRVLKTHPIRVIQYGNLKLSLDKNTYEILNIERNDLDEYQVARDLKRKFEWKYYNIVV
jgi:transcriptional regulatory protein LevR